MDSFFLTLGIALVLLGLLLLAADLFIGSGVLFVLALTSVLVGLVFLFKHDTTAGIIGLVATVVGGPALTVFLLRISPLRGAALEAELPPEEQPLEELASLKGRLGKTLSQMHPAGMIDFDGRRVDGLTEGMMVERGRLVRCIDVRAGQVIVRPIDTTGVKSAESDLNF